MRNLITSKGGVLLLLCATCAIASKYEGFDMISTSTIVSNSYKDYDMLSMDNIDDSELLYLWDLYLPSDARESLSTQTTEARSNCRATAKDTAWEKKFKKNGGILDVAEAFYPSNSEELKDARADRVRARLNPYLCGKEGAQVGSGPYNDITPPGWKEGSCRDRGTGKNATRGHLLGRLLGGSGRDVRNVAMLCQDTNDAHEIFERALALIYNDSENYGTGPLNVKCKVWVEAKALYRSGKDAPYAIHYKAVIENSSGDIVGDPFFNVQISNEQLSDEAVGEIEIPPEVFQRAEVYLKYLTKEVGPNGVSEAPAKFPKKENLNETIRC